MDFEDFYKRFESYLSKMNNEEVRGEDVWSEWLDFNYSSITNANIPDKPGVFKVHASMKILYIGSGKNLRQSLLESLSDPCIARARRFSYLLTDGEENKKDQLLNEYRVSHNGALPSCMDKE